MSYLMGALANLAAVRYCIEAGRGRQISGRAWDTVVLVFSATVWLLCLRGNNNTKAITTWGGDQSFYNFMFARLAGGCLFLFVWQLRSSHVVMRRIETEEKREEAIQSRVLLKEREMSVRLLRRMVPPRIASDLSRGKSVPPELYAFATVFYSDISGFNKFAAQNTPLDVFAMLHRLFKVMDHCVALFPNELYKVDNGDAYVVVGGLDIDGDDEEHARLESFGAGSVALATCHFALLVREAVQMVPFGDNNFASIRIGIHTGPVVTGIIGEMVPRFSVMGDTVTAAGNIQALGETNKILVSEAFSSLVQQTHTPQLTDLVFSFEARGHVEVKGKRDVATFWLEPRDLVDFRRLHEGPLLEVEALVRAFKAEHYALSSDGTIVLVPDGGDGAATPPPHLPSLTDILTAASESAAAGSDQVAIEMSAAGLGFGVGAGVGPGASQSDDDWMRLLPNPPPRFSFEQLVAPGWDVRSLQGDYDGIFEAILVLMEGAVGSSAGCSAVTEPGTLRRLVRRVGSFYQNVPYHNWFHALCVVQQTAALVAHLGLSAHLNQRERFVLMLSALVHDVGHPGHNNKLEVYRKSSLALLYNDQSVLEMHHLALAFNIMANRSYNVFAGWSKEEAAQARAFMIACVLATDMDMHISLQDELVRRKERPAEQGPFNLKSEADRTLLAKCVLHAADISNPTRPFRSSAPISLLAIKEFQSQAQEEESLGLPVMPFFVFTDFASKCKGEAGFAQFVARPYFDALLACLPPTQAAIDLGFDPVATIDDNVALWKLQMNNDDLRI